MKPGQSKDIASIYQQALGNGQAFAAYRLPGSEKVNHILGEISRKLKADQSAFAFAPFDPKEKPYYIIDQSKLTEKEQTSIIYKNKKQRSTNKSEFIKLIKRIISEVKSEHFKKIVAARILAIDKPTAFNAFNLFEKLSGQYPSAFVSLTYIPNVGLWIGASPEVLVSETSSKLTIYSLAGTKVIEDDSDWSSKEIEEQKIVTDFIHKKLGQAVDDKIKLKGPITHDAGRVKHLLSVFTIQHQGKSLWKKVVKALHPTPAVGGLPQHKAVNFLTKQESFDRAFYAGYLGPVHCNKRTDLFVNLRCMQVTDTQLLFYAGCGITADSDPEKEWQESERKIDVLKSLI